MVNYPGQICDLLGSHALSQEQLAIDKTWLVRANNAPAKTRFGAITEYFHGS
jgi:hypothetical protein